MQAAAAAASSSSIADEVRSTASLDDSFIASALESTGSHNGGIGPTSSGSGEEEKKNNHSSSSRSGGGGNGGGLDNDDISGIGDDPGSPTQMSRRFAVVDDHYNYNPIGMTIGDDWQQLSSPTSPTSMNIAGTGTGAGNLARSPVVRSTSTTTYGRVNQSHAIHSSVHMHVQENAKISTYNQPVDRSNSTLKGTIYNSNSINNSNNNKRRRVASGSGGGTSVGGGGSTFLGSNSNNNYNAAPSNNNNNNDETNGHVMDAQHQQPPNSNSATMANGTHNDGDGDDDIDSNSLLGESMAEIFLSKESTNRRSLDLNYQIFGSLPADVRFENRRTYSGGDGGSGSGLGIGGGGGGVDEETQMEMDALTAAIDPTPWSEIEGKINADVRNERMKQHQQQQQQQQQQQSSYMTTGSSDPIQQYHPHQSSYYPYGRHYQLPIPGKPASPPPVQAAAAAAAAAATAGAGGMADALATAAALAVATGAETGTSTGGTGASSKNVNVNAPQTGQSQTTTTTTSAVSTSAPISSRHTYQRYRADSSTVQPRATSKASVLAAANKKSQYGFGGDHTVPSVPAPPQWKVNNSKQMSPNPGYHKRGIATSTGSAKLAMRPSTSVPRAAAAAAASSGIPPKLPTHMQPGSAASKAAAAASSFLSNKAPASASSKLLTDQSMTYTQSNSGAAYERKKQRAKDARVKLNESIDRMSIAMGLAGSQSKQRVDQLKSGSLMSTDVRQKTIQINEQCARLADQAKKWDRPSFVGTAASIIQSLNAQCESLILELYSMQSMVSTTESNQDQQIQEQQPTQQQELAIDATTTTVNALSGEGRRQTTTYPPLIDTSSEAVATANGNLSSSPTLHPEHKRHEHPTEEESPESSKKRQRGLQPDDRQSQLFSNGTNLEGNSTENEKIIFDSVSRFLDPVSLCRCRNVSKKWNEMDGFANNDLWLSLSVKRFGFYNVRQWNEKLEDAETEEGKVPSVRLYKEMNSANVMPHFAHEGMSLLGDAMIPGRASGWVFLVERSNGETLRSVRQQPSSDGGPGTGGMYQSRPVVELRIMIQNTGMASQPIVLKNQIIAVDVSTRRSGGELKEIDWDHRFKKVVRNLDGTPRRLPNDAANMKISQAAGGCGVICKLDLFETAVIEVHLNARGCTTTSKFQQRSNFTKLLVTLDGTTVPMVIPFLRDHHHGVH